MSKIKPEDNPAYRKGVVGVFINASKQVLLCERSNLPGVWQFPQGGIDDHEDPHTAVMREMKEELGVTAFRLTGEGQSWTSYDFPPDATFPLAKKFRGQCHWWFSLVFESGTSPNLALSDGEFMSLKWVSIDQVMVDIVAWKQNSYKLGLKQLGLLESED